MALNNIASVGYNSRADNQGHPINRTGNLPDDQTDDATAYVKGLTIVKTANRTLWASAISSAWTLTVTVPANVNGYWLVVEENDLPPGYDYITGTTCGERRGLDDVNHAQNPKDDGNRDLRWYLNSIENASATDYAFTIRFATLVTGVDGKNPNTTYYPNNCCLDYGDNTVRVGWYDKPTGWTGRQQPGQRRLRWLRDQSHRPAQPGRHRTAWRCVNPIWTSRKRHPKPGRRRMTRDLHPLCGEHRHPQCLRHRLVDLLPVGVNFQQVDEHPGDLSIP